MTCDAVQEAHLRVLLHAIGLTAAALVRAEPVRHHGGRGHPVGLEGVHSRSESHIRHCRQARTSGNAKGQV